MKKLGIIGGLGPMATAYFLELIVQMTKAEEDQQHIEIFLHNCPSIPDRTEYIMGRSKENPFEKMAEIGKSLAACADVLAIPCITAHYFHQELQRAIGEVPLLNAIRETADYLKERGCGCVGVMATEAVASMDLFGRELDACGIRAVSPDKEHQKLVTRLIYEDVKAGRKLEDAVFQKVREHLFGKGAEVILLGCTELSMLKKEKMTGPGFLDVLEVLAQCCVERCAVVKDDWRELITEA